MVLFEFEHSVCTEFEELRGGLGFGDLGVRRSGGRRPGTIDGGKTERERAKWQIIAAEVIGAKRRKT